MHVIARIDGWEKIVEVPERSAMQGRIELGFFLQSSYLIPTGPPTKDSGATLYMLTYTGERKNGYYVFEWI
jgi:hypothetical protein